MAMLLKQNKALMNMDPDNDDPNERYKMHRVQIKHEGKRSGKVTLILNILIIVKDILGTKMESQRDKADDAAQCQYSDAVMEHTATHVCKFMSRSLGATAKFRKARRVIILNGHFEVDTVQDIVFAYVRTFAQCPQCHLPELTPAVLKDVRCKSCGYAIGKHSKVQKQKKKGKKRKGKRKAKAQKPDTSSSDSDEPATIAPVRESAECVLRRYVAQKADASSEDVLEKLKILSLAHELGVQGRMELALRGLVMSDDSDWRSVVAAIERHCAVLAWLTKNDGNPLYARVFLKCFQGLAESNISLQRHWHRVLQALYDCNVVWEDVVVAWFNGETRLMAQHGGDERRVLIESARPFIEWLQEADEEEEEGDQDNDGGVED